MSPPWSAAVRLLVVSLLLTARLDAATLGSPAIGAVKDTGDAHYMNAWRFTMPPTAGGTMTAMAVYVYAPISAAPNNQFQVALYTQTGTGPGSLVAASASQPLTANAWNTVTLSGTLAPGASYWLAYNTNAASAAANNVPQGAVGTGLHVWRAQPFGAWPTTFGAIQGSSTQTGSLYATYTPSDAIPPTAPGPLTGTATSPTAISLAWGAATDNVGVVSYTLTKDGQLLVTIPVLAYEAGGLTPATSYAFAVTARDAAGNTSPPSNTVTVQTLPGTPPPGGQGELLSQADLVYVGAFRVPGGAFGSSRFGYGGTSLGYDASAQGLYMVGHDWDQQVAEIAVPQILNSPTVEGLATATVLQPFSDTLAGKLGQINPSDGNTKKIGGTFVYHNKLYVTGYSYYDGSGTQSASHFMRPQALAGGTVHGPVTVGTTYPGFVSGYMTPIPDAWQAAFGGPALTGHCCLAIVGYQSSGPALSVFDPAQVDTGSVIPATPLLGYPIAHPLGQWGTQNPYYNGTTRIRGVVFPTQTRSVLFFGRHGTGPFCYGPGTSDPAKAGTPAPGGVDVYCYDPDEGSKGTHAYPYVTQVWAYDAAELLEVKQGQRDPWSVLPYALWHLTVPYGGGSGVGGAAYDAATGRIFVSQTCVEWPSCLPIIHVWQAP